MRNLRRPGLLGLSPSTDRSFGHEWSLRGGHAGQPEGRTDGIGPTSPPVRRPVYTRPKSESTWAPNADVAPYGAPVQLRNAWDSPQSLQFVIDEWEQDRGDNSLGLRVLRAVDVIEAVRSVAKILQISTEEASRLIRAGRVANTVWKGVLVDLGLQALAWGMEREQDQIQYWLPVAKTRQAELLRRQ